MNHHILQPTNVFISHFWGVLFSIVCCSASLFSAPLFAEESNPELDADEEIYLEDFQYLLDLDEGDIKPWQVKLELENTLDDSAAWNSVGSFDYFGLFKTNDYFYASFQTDSVEDYYAVAGHYSMDPFKNAPLRIELDAIYTFDDEDTLFGPFLTNQEVESEEEVYQWIGNLLYNIQDTAAVSHAIYAGFDMTQSRIKGSTQTRRGNVNVDISIGHVGYRMESLSIKHKTDVQKEFIQWGDISLGRQIGTDDQPDILVSLGRGYQDGFRLMLWSYTAQWRTKAKNNKAHPSWHKEKAWSVTVMGQNSFDDPIPRYYQSSFSGQYGVRGYQPGLFQSDSHWIVRLEREIKVKGLQLKVFTDYGWFNIAPHPIQFTTSIEETPLLQQILLDQERFILLERITSVTTSIRVEDDGNAWGAGIGFVFEFGNGFELEGNVAAALKDLELNYPINVNIRTPNLKIADDFSQSLTVAEQGDVNAFVRLSFSY